MATYHKISSTRRPCRGPATLGLGLVLLLAGAGSVSADALRGVYEIRRGTRTNEAIGTDVSTAGDVNGDGMSDLLVTEGFIDRGAVWCYDGAASPSFGSPAWSFAGTMTLDLRGCEVAPAGDVNADGFDDVIVGAPLFTNGESNEGAVFIFLGSASGLAATPQIVIEGNAPIAGGFGSSVDAAGDVNGDGFDDVIIGSSLFSNGQSFEGQARVYPGSAGGVLGAPLWTFESDVAGAHFGFNVAGCGDVDADGYDDIVVSAPDLSNGQTTEGRVYLFSGRPSGLTLLPSWSFESNVVGGRCGFGLGMAGDLNGDGFSDIAFDTGSNAPATAGVDVFLGRAGTPSSTPDRFYPNNAGGFADVLGTAGDVNGDGCADLVANNIGFSSNTGQVTVLGGSETGASLSMIAVRSGPQAAETFGTDVRSAGDVNGDGFGDLIIGSNAFDAGGVDNVGIARLYVGCGLLPDSTEQWSQDVVQSGAHYAWSVAQGDWNGDGFGDVAIGCPDDDSGTPDKGFAQVFYGAEAIYAESSSWFDFGQDASGKFGYSVGNAGDVNGDGYDDLIVGEPYNASGGFPNVGAAYVYYGSASGLAANPSWTRGGGTVPGHFGWSVGGAGDVNGDGYADVVVGAPDFDFVPERGGRALVYLGGPAGPSINPAWTIAGPTVGDKVGYAVAGGGDVNGDGFDDVIVGAPGKDNGQSDEGFVFVYFGGAAGSSGSWSVEGDQGGAGFGKALSPAGDANGDGYADIVIGAPDFDAFSGVDRGTAISFLGGPSNVLTLNWQEYGMIAGDRFGAAVAGGGDVNGDGYSDIVAGAPSYDLTATNAGAVYLRGGGPGGISANFLWNEFATDDQSQFGSALSLAGDATGDGFADVVVGQPYSGNSVGRASCFYGGRQGMTATEIAGVLRKPAQVRSDGATPIALGGMSDGVDGFHLRAYARSAKGRSAVVAEYQAAPAGSGWSGAPVPGPALDTGVPVAGLGSATLVTVPVTSLALQDTYHWRVRFRGDSPYFPTTAWLSVPGAGRGAADVRLPNPTGVDAPAARAPSPLAAPRVGPNPCRDAATVWFSLPEAAAARVTVYDVTGRRVASLLDATLPAGPQKTSWDTRDDAGRPVAAGVYLLELERGAGRSSTKFIVRR